MTRTSRLRIAAFIVLTAIVFPGRNAYAQRTTRGAISFDLIAVEPGPGRCGGDPRFIEADFTGSGVDSLAGPFAFTASLCIDTETLHVFDSQVTHTYALSGDQLFVRYADWDESVDLERCFQTSSGPILGEVTGGSGSLAGARGTLRVDFVGTYDICAVAVAPLDIAYLEGTVIIPRP